MVIKKNKFPIDEIHSGFYFQERNKILLLKNCQKAYLYFKDKRVNLLTNKVDSFTAEDFLKSLHLKKINRNQKKYQVYHFYYELGALINRVGRIRKNIPLALELTYKEKSWVDTPKEIKGKILVEKKKSISKTRYQVGFEEIQRNLLKGNCYQVNFTNQFSWEIKEDKFFDKVLNNFYANKSLSAYAHHTFLPLQEELILSNSPECLFQFYEGEKPSVHSMPIKGTIKGEKKEEAKKLFYSKKNEAELYMISDLIRNDLCRIDRPDAIISRKKCLLKVPNLWHLYSRVQCPVHSRVTLGNIIEALFPGGSITGAPKKRVMEMIGKLELDERGVYCGSTYLECGKVKTANINIRTAILNQKTKELKIGAGGGITLNSHLDEEYLEMLHKVESLLQMLHVEVEGEI